MCSMHYSDRTRHHNDAIYKQMLVAHKPEITATTPYHTVAFADNNYTQVVVTRKSLHAGMLVANKPEITATTPHHKVDIEDAHYT